MRAINAHHKTNQEVGNYFVCVMIILKAGSI